MCIRDSNDPSARSDNPITWREVIGPDLRLIHDPVPIRISQQLDHSILLPDCLLCDLSPLELPSDAPNRFIEFTALVEFLRIDVPLDIVAMELANENPPMFVKGDAGRLLDYWFARNQINLKSLG